MTMFVLFNYKLDCPGFAKSISINEYSLLIIISIVELYRNTSIT